MIRHYFNSFLFLTIVLFGTRCAQVVPLSGGPRDVTPPKLVESLPAQAALNFNSDIITLKFNEYVQLKDLKNQLLISPKLKTEPEIEADGKKIKISLKKEELLPNTTYKIFFGKSVVDMTEGNAIPGFEYIFSTGNIIDTLKMGGNVSEMFNQKAAGEIIVGLYTSNTNWNDSTIYKEAPDYITKTTSEGNFTFRNLPDKPFNLIAFTDKNKNKLYDGETEKIAFYPKLVDLSVDSTVKLKLFQEEPSKTFLKKKYSPSYGITQLIYNKKNVFQVFVSDNANNDKVTETMPGREKDTITLLYHDIKDTLGVLVKNIKSGSIDTIKVALPKNTINRKKSLFYSTNIQTGTLNYNSGVELTFLNQLDTVKTHLKDVKLVSKKDSTTTSENLTYQYSWPNKIIATNTIKEGVDYRIKLDTALIYDLNGRYNDSTFFSFKRQNKTDLGKLTLKLLLNKKQSYIVQLINDKDQAVKEDYISFSLSSSNATSIDFTGVLPGVYTVKIIFDDNDDKKWNTGKYLSKKQPEEVFISTKQIKIVSDWDAEEEILVK